MRKYKILAICGSTRKTSSNHQLIRAIQKLAENRFDVEIFNGLDRVAHFNPDIEGDDPGGVVERAPTDGLAYVAKFRNEVRAADAVLICMPEYAIGVPGTLKNAIDWTVSSMEFSEKPVALITASTSGYLAHQSLLGTLLIIEARLTLETQFVIPMIKTKLREAAGDVQVTDTPTLMKLMTLLERLGEMVQGHVPKESYLPAPLLK